MSHEQSLAQDEFQEETVRIIYKNSSSDRKSPYRSVGDHHSVSFDKEKESARSFFHQATL